MKSIVSSFCLLQASIGAWGHLNEVHPEEVSIQTSSHFPYAPDQDWFIDPSYLLWIPFMENMDYGTRIETDSNFKNFVIPPTNFTFRSDNKMKTKKPEFDWDSGVRVGVGKYLPHHDQWDISIYGTYFYGQADDKTSTNAANSVGIAPNFSLSSALFPMNKSSTFWQLNYFTFDLIVGRNFQLGSHVIFHPYFGIRETSQYQEFKNRYRLDEISFFSINQLVTIFESFTQKGNNDYWGVGPRIGSHLIFNFARGWSILGNLAASIVLGQHKLNQKTKLIFTEQSINISGTLVQVNKSKDKLNAIRANLEGYLGLGWEKWVQNHQVRIAPSVLFEGVVWFAMNQLWNLWPQSSAEDFDNVATRKHGNLGLMGVTFDFQVDF